MKNQNQNEQRDPTAGMSDTEREIYLKRLAQQTQEAEEAEKKGLQDIADKMKQGNIPGVIEVTPETQK